MGNEYAGLIYGGGGLVYMEVFSITNVVVTV
jgi:hypothetical protein